MGLKGRQEKQTETVNPCMLIGNAHQSIRIPETLHALPGGHVAALGTVLDLPGATTPLESTYTPLELALCTVAHVLRISLTSISGTLRAILELLQAPREPLLASKKGLKFQEQ